MKRTPLFSAHQKLAAKLVEFGGWEMPVHYTSITEEHLAVRNAAGVFDISHMGEVLVNGAGAESFLNRVLTNDLRKLTPGEGQYTIMCNEAGGAIDDLYAYRLAREEYLLIINAARIENDIAWLEKQLSGGQPTTDPATLKNISDTTGAVAVQGPLVANFIDQCFPGPFSASISRVTELKKNQLTRTSSQGGQIWISRTGYTGEDGFEIVAPAEMIEQIWNEILSCGDAHGLKPAGLGARDTLRTEVCYPLYGHELDEQTTPIEAGLGFFVALDKGEFLGRAALAAQKANGVRKKLAAFKMNGKSAPPRPGYAIWSSDRNSPVGQVVSGTQSPSLGIGIGMGYLPPELAKADNSVNIEIRGKRCAAVIVPKPIYRKPRGND